MSFAVIGCGSIAETHAKALRSLPDHTRLAACHDIDPARAEAFAARHGVRAMNWAAILADASIEAVTVCTPSGLHAQHAVEALRAGKHVVVEKPMDVTLAACDAILAAEASGKGRVGVICQHRFDPASRFAKEVIERGDLGKLVLIDAKVPWYRTQDYYDSGDWRGTWALDGGGCVMNQGIHTVDLMLWLAGPVERTHAVMRTRAHERIEVEDVLCSTLEFANGAIGSFVATTAAYPGFPVRLALYGTKGTLVLEGDELQLLAIEGREMKSGPGASAHARQVAGGGTRAAVEGSTGTALNSGAWVWGDAHRAQFRDFVECVRDGRDPLSNSRSGRAAVELILRMYGRER